MTTTLASVFVVSLSAGSYDDKWEKVIRTFTKREDAQRFVDRKNRAIAHVEGMERAKHAMVAAWEKSHPCPDYDTSSSKERDEWYDAKYAEEGRISDLLGLEKEWEATGAGLYCNEHARYFVNEVPLDGDPWDDVG